MRPGFLPPIHGGDHQHSNNNDPRRAVSDVHDRSDMFARDQQQQHHEQQQDEPYARRPHEVSPMAHSTRHDFAADEGGDDAEYDSGGGDDGDSVGDGRDSDVDDDDGGDGDSQSSSASVDSETGEPVYNYNGEVWDEGAGRFVPGRHSPLASPTATVGSPAAGMLGGVNPVVAAYDGGGGSSPAASAAASPGYAARALMKKQLMGGKSASPSGAHRQPKVPPKGGKAPRGYLAQFQQGRVPRR